MRKIRKPALYLTYLAIVLALSVIIVLSFSPKLPEPSKPSTSHKSTTLPHSISKSKTSSTSSNPASPPLTDTGPGDTVGIFLGSSLVFTLAHYLVTRNRSQKLEKLLTTQT